VHDYTPAVLTHFASWERGIDHEAMASLPFPVTDIAACRAVLARTAHARTREVGEYYCGERWDEARVRENLSRAGAWGRRHGVPVALLEFGALTKLNAGARLAYLAAVRKAAEQEGMGWALWGYADIMGFPAASGPRPAVIDRAVLGALGLPSDAR
jgi:endoglucanase